MFSDSKEVFHSGIDSRLSSEENANRREAQVAPNFTKIGRAMYSSYDGRLKIALCLSDVDETTARARELFEDMKERGLVPLSDLLDGKVEQAGRIDVEEMYRLAQAIGMESERHRESPVTPEKVWVRLADLTKQQSIDDHKVLWFTPAQLGAKYHKDAQTMRLWAQEGFFIERGYRLSKDPTGHWFIGIPPNHPDYLEFLSFRQSLRR